MHPGRGAERMVFILDTEYLRRYFNGLSFHHLVWSLERTNSSFRSSSFRSIEGSGREGDRHREMQKKVPRDSPQQGNVMRDAMGVITGFAKGTICYGCCEGNCQRKMWKMEPRDSPQGKCNARSRCNSSSLVFFGEGKTFYMSCVPLLYCLITVSSLSPHIFCLHFLAGRVSLLIRLLIQFLVLSLVGPRYQYI